MALNARPVISPLWALPLGVVTGMGLGVAAGVLSPALMYDLVAWWPVWLGGLAAAVLLKRRVSESVRTGGVTALLLGVATTVFMAAHISGWALMPSAGGRLVGPEPTGIEAASLTAVIHGRVDVGAGSAFLYQVVPIRWGGDYGLPHAFEEVPNPETIDVLLAPVADSGLNSFAGWDITLSSSPVWSLDLAGVVSADLSGLDVFDLVLGGSGRVTLGGVTFIRSILVNGTFELFFPTGVPVSVVGEASVPDGWVETDDGWASPVEGEAWVVTVVPGSIVTVATP